MGCEKLPSCLEFSFDKAVTIEEMIENSGEPTYKDDDEVSFTEVSKTFNTQEKVDIRLLFRILKYKE